MADAGWTLDEFVAQVAAVLGNGGGVPSSRRVRQVPDRRAVRWYTTIGLLDRPRLRGRTGWYGPRHLLQLVAVKRLQATGRPLADIQAALAGATDAELRRIADVPAGLLDGAPQPAPISPRSRFWGDPPAEPDPSPPAAGPDPIPSRDGSRRTRPRGRERPDGGTRPTAMSADPAAAGEPVDSPDGAGVRYALDLAEGITLLLDAPPGVLPDSDDLSAVRAAARPMLHQLARRGLARAVPEGDLS